MVENGPSKKAHEEVGIATEVAVAVIKTAAISHRYSTLDLKSITIWASKPGTSSEKNKLLRASTCPPSQHHKLSGLPPAAANRRRFGSQRHPQLQPAPKSQPIPEWNEILAYGRRFKPQPASTRCDLRIASPTRRFLQVI